MPSPFQPIPGTRTAPRGLFVDHWGTLLRKPARGFATSPDEIEFQPEAISALFQAGQQDWNIYLIGNESSVPDGHVDAATWQSIEDHVINTLHRHGIAITRNYICTDHPEGKKPHDKDSVYLLPNTGAMYHAMQEDGLALRSCWVLGDGPLELAAGWRAGCRTAGVDLSGEVRAGALAVEPEVFADSLAHALSQIVTGVAMTRL